jgi:phosphoenolpyruvate carboxykinase (ATP)
LEQATRVLATEPLVSIDVQVGDGSERITARLIVPRRFAHVAYGGLKLFKPALTSDPTYQVIMFFDEGHEKNKGKPLQKDITIRLAQADGRLSRWSATAITWANGRRACSRAKITG